MDKIYDILETAIDSLGEVEEEEIQERIAQLRNKLKKENKNNDKNN